MLFGYLITSCRSFVNNVWYIKILSPEDIQKMGEEAIESLGPSSGQRMNNTGAESHDIVSGLPSLGSLEYWDNITKYSFRSYGQIDNYVLLLLLLLLLSRICYLCLSTIYQPCIFWIYYVLSIPCLLLLFVSGLLKLSQKKDEKFRANFWTNL